MADNKKQTSLPMLGIDTASPDHEVKDGKCSELHNLRYAAGAWRNVHPFVKKHSFHGDLTDATKYYAWVSETQTVYSTATPQQIMRGDLLYKRDESGHFVFTYYVKQIFSQEDGSVSIRITETKPENNIYAWSTVDGKTTAWSRLEAVSIGDILYNSNGLTRKGEVQMVIRDSSTGTIQLMATLDDGTTKELVRNRQQDRNMSELPSLTGTHIYTSEKDESISNKQYEIIYHHPADADNRYIATVENNWTETYYAWCNTAGIIVCYSLAEPDKISVGDALYDRPDMEFAPEYFEQIGTVAGVNADGSISYRMETYSHAEFYGWASEAGAEYYTRSATPQVEDDVFALVENTYLNSVGKITKVEGIVEETGSNLKLSTDMGEDVLSRNMDGDALYYFYTTKLLSLSYSSDYNHTVSKSGMQFAVIEIAGGEAVIRQRLQECLRANQYGIHHFGNILIISDKTDKQMYYYMKSGDSYILIDYSTVTITAEMIKPKSVIDGKTYSATHKSRSLKSHEVLEGFDDSRYYAEAVCQFRGSEVYYIDHEDLFWRGELAYFCAVRDKSGEILATTPMQIINSQEFSDNKGNEEFLRLGIKGMGGVAKDEYAGQTWYLRIGDNKKSGPETATNIMCRPDVRISCNFGTDEIRKNIADVAVYATRIYPNIDYEKLSITETATTNQPKFTSGCVPRTDIHKVLMKNNLPEQPFYLAKTISIDEFTANEYIVRLDYKLLENIEHNILYEPSSSEYSYFGDSMIEYNNRLHLCGIKQVFPKPKKDAFAYDTQISDRQVVLVKYNYGDGVYYATRTAPVSFAEKQPALLTYPSSSAAEMYFAKRDIGTIGNYPVLAKYKLTPVASMDIAYYLNYSTSGNLRYADNVIPATSQESVSADISACPTIGNRIQVSENNNCFVFPFANSYRIGTQNNRIIAVNSAAIEMSDSKFGEFPLYVFTEEGIFAMQSGTETLYSAIVPIAYDKAISPHTLAINYNVLFISARGLMALSSGGLVCLSAELNTKDNLIPEFLRTARLVRLPKYNEVMAINEDDSTAYIFSLDNKVWSTRDISIGHILNNNEMVVANNEIIDITSESDAPQTMSFLIDTRQVKLGAMELKRVETVIVRFESATAQTINVEIYGSINLTSWIPIRTAQVTTNKDIIIRRAPMSAKYLRFRVFGAVTDDIKIMTLDLEYYFRMLHRMR